MWLFSGCKQLIKTTGTAIEIGTTKGPIKLPIEVQGVKIKRELLQTTSQILMVLDWLQFTKCQQIEGLKKMKNAPETMIANLVAKQMGRR